MLTGFNTDIEFDGVTYHVQTEDRGGGNPLIESLVYVRGEILAARRTEYRNLLEAGADKSAIRTLMERQHRAIVEVIRNGRLDVLTEPHVGAESDTTVSRRPLVGSQRAGAPGADAARKSQRTLDEVIADWLSEQQREERVRVQVEGGDDLHFAAPFRLRVRVATTPGDTPVARAHVVVRMLSTATKPVKLGEGHSDGAGVLEVAGELPELKKGTGLVVVAVQHPSGSDEIKFLIKR
ncbi:MAG: hypothetical protein ACM3O7_05085 [Acidobacteriota bacterium]